MTEKKYILCNNTHHDITDLVNRGIDKNTKTGIILRMEYSFPTKRKN